MLGSCFCIEVRNMVVIIIIMWSGGDREFSLHLR